MTQPVVGAFTQIGQRVAQGGPEDLAVLQEENERLTRQVDDLIIENAKLTIRLVELTETASAASYLEERQLPFLLARTTNVFTYQDASTILIDRGESDGVRVGQAIVLREGFLVGVVRETFSHSARVRLLFDNDTNLSATFAGDGAPQGIVVGELGLALRMELIPRDVEVKEHAVVLTAGIEEAIPQGLVIGEVFSVNDPGSALFQTAQLTALWDISELATVAVVTL
jgi:cell shape-determining protein MreC